jgi:uncharacterized damage-inducible protein DinB
MSTVLADRFRRWFDYEKDAHEKTLASLEALTPAQKESHEYAKASGLLAHIVLARWLWLTRLGIVAPGNAPTSDDDYFPTGVTTEDLRRRLDAMQQAWSRYLATLDDDALANVFRYHALDGPEFTNTVEEVLTQLFGHSWYHRGQIASLVRAAGGDPAATDLIYWARRPVGEGA